MARRRESAGQARAPINRSSDPLTHPIHLLRARLEDDFTADLPTGVEPVDHWCRDPQFFPGATGLLTNSSWADVVPGGHGFSDNPPPARQRGVVVLGNVGFFLGAFASARLARQIGLGPTIFVASCLATIATTLLPLATGPAGGQTFAASRAAAWR